jgi:uncharacterized protein DUF6069
MATQTSPLAASVDHSASGRYVLGGLVAGLVAALVNGSVALVAHRAGADLELPRGGEAIPVLAFPQLTLLGACLGIGLARLLRTRSTRPAQTFTWTCVGLTALSFLPPILADATTATTVVLLSAHLVAACIVVPTIAFRLTAGRGRGMS